MKADLTFSDEVAERLRALAAREGRSVDEVVRDMMKQYTPAQQDEVPQEKVEDEPRPGSGAALLKSALAANIRTGHRDTAERSREILDTEFPEYLRKRLNTS